MVTGARAAPPHPACLHLHRASVRSECEPKLSWAFSQKRLKICAVQCTRAHTHTQSGSESEATCWWPQYTHAHTHTTNPVTTTYASVLGTIAGRSNFQLPNKHTRDSCHKCYCTQMEMKRGKFPGSIEGPTYLGLPHLPVGPTFFFTQHVPLPAMPRNNKLVDGSRLQPRAT